MSATTPTFYKPESGVKERILRAAGIDSSAMRYPLTNPVTGQPSTAHDLSFMTNSDDIFEPRRNISSDSARLRRANIKAQQGILLDEAKVGDVITASPIEEPGQANNRRSLIYDRATKGALKSAQDPVSGETKIRALKSGDSEFINTLKQRVKFNPKSLFSDLSKLAVKKITARLGGPKVQAAMGVDEVVGGVTGERLSERIGRGSGLRSKRKSRDD